MARKTGFRSSAAESFRFSKLVICVKCHGFSRGYLQTNKVLKSASNSAYSLVKFEEVLRYQLVAGTINP